MKGIETTPKEVNPMGCKRMFVRKHDEFGNVSQYKVLLIA